ncbi:MAG TPA: hypothetical protein VI306_02020 [Pyrinomonadaceae bacterium]
MSTQRTEFISIAQPTIFEIDRRHFDGLRYFVRRIFSCWHLRLARPVTHGQESYRACLRCGMRRKFDLENWKSSGRFYTPVVDRRHQ